MLTLFSAEASARLANDILRATVRSGKWTPLPRRSGLQGRSFVAGVFGTLDALELPPVAIGVSLIFGVRRDLRTRWRELDAAVDAEVLTVGVSRGGILGRGVSMVGWRRGSSPPRMLGLRCRLALGRFDRLTEASLLVLDALFVGRGMDFLLLLGCSIITGGEDPTGEGLVAFTRAFLAFRLRNFSSSSDDVTSESFPLMLIAPELRLEDAP